MLECRGLHNVEIKRLANVCCRISCFRNTRARRHLKCQLEVHAHNYFSLGYDFSMFLKRYPFSASTFFC